LFTLYRVAASAGVANATEETTARDSDETAAMSPFTA
jgi:hypothetical protein